MTSQEITVIISLVGIVSVAINVYVGLRLATVQARMEANAATLKASLVKEFAMWKDEVLNAINGKYVSAALVAEIKGSIVHELAQIAARLEHQERRCEARTTECLVLRTRDSQAREE